MISTSKTILVVGAIAAFVAVGPVGEEAEAEPVVSSWYGSELEGAPTASGEPYRPDEHTAAHPSLPFGTELLVTYGQQQTVVRVTDRGPYAEGREIDLSHAAAQDIGLTTTGADAIDVRVLDDPDVHNEYDLSEEYVPTKGHASREEYTPRKDRDGIASYLRERPYLRILGAVAPYSRPSTSACHDASMMFAPTPTAPQTRLPSVESIRTRVVAAVARCSSRMRTL